MFLCVCLFGFLISISKTLVADILLFTQTPMFCSYVLQELVETERAYVTDLALIIDGYVASINQMELSDEDREKMKIVFANINQILDFHKM